MNQEISVGVSVVRSFQVVKVSRLRVAVGSQGNLSLAHETSLPTGAREPLATFNMYSS